MCVLFYHKIININFDKAFLYAFSQIIFSPLYGIPYMVKHSREKTFAFRVENGLFTGKLTQ